MLPKHFFENFFQGKQDENLFVCMPFDHTLDSKFNTIKEIAENNLGDRYNFKEVIRTKEEWAMGDLTEEIFNGIAHAKILLFDLSDDPNYKEINPNVIYELGVALTFRSKEDILLIREKSGKCIKDLPFDINHLSIREYEDLTKNDWLKNLLINRIDYREKYKERVLSGVHRAVDDIGFFIIKNFASISGGKSPFNVPGVYMALLQAQTSAPLKPSIEEVRSSVLRLLDLGIARSQARYQPGNALEYNYYFTELGREVARYMEREGGSGSLL